MSKVHEQIEVEQHDSPAPRSRSREGGMFLAFGGMCALVGVAATILPRMSWKADQIMAGFETLGVDSGTLLMGGLVLMALGLVRRAQDAARPDNDQELLMEQIATDLMELRGSLEDLRGSAAALSGRVEFVGGAVAQIGEQIEARNAVPAHSQDALFQLAASLDKLGARLDQRLKVNHTMVQESLEELVSSIEHSRRSVEERVPVALSHLIDNPIENTVYEQTPIVTAPAEQSCDAAHSRGSLGVLDSITDDIPAALPADAQTHGIDFDHLDQQSPELARGMEATSRAAQSGGAWDDEPMAEHDASDTAQKLEQLQSLLSDERLRAALDSMRRR